MTTRRTEDTHEVDGLLEERSAAEMKTDVEAAGANKCGTGPVLCFCKLMFYLVSPAMATAVVFNICASLWFTPTPNPPPASPPASPPPSPIWPPAPVRCSPLVCDDGTISHGVQHAACIRNLTVVKQIRECESGFDFQCQFTRSAAEFTRAHWALYNESGLFAALLSQSICTDTFQRVLDIKENSTHNRVGRSHIALLDELAGRNGHFIFDLTPHNVIPRADGSFVIIDASILPQRKESYFRAIVYWVHETDRLLPGCSHLYVRDVERWTVFNDSGAR